MPRRDTSPPSPEPPPPPFFIADWRVEPGRNLLERGGTGAKLEPKVMSLLLALAESPGEVVSRERLFATVWPDVVVGDDALTMAVSKLRRALGDDPQRPRFVETITKIGYRLVAPVAAVRADPASDDPTGTAPAPTAPLDDPGSDGDATTIGDPDPTDSQNRVRRGVSYGILVGAGLAALGLYAANVAGFRPAEGPAPGPSAGTHPGQPAESILTNSPGSESQARLSPDGGTLVFVRPFGDDAGLYAQNLADGKQTLVTRRRGGLASPAWSPEGDQIAYLDCPRARAGPCDLAITNLLGEDLGRPLTYLASPLVGIDWSPDGRFLAVSRRTDPHHPFALYEIELATGELRRLTEPPSGHLGDGRPTYSPDGERLAFCRGPGLFQQDLYILDRSGGPPRRLFANSGRIWGLTWNADGKELIFSSNRDGPYQLYRIDIDEGGLRWLPTHAREVRFPRVTGDRLLFETFGLDADLWTLDAAGEPRRLGGLASNRWDISPRHAPGGGRLAFVSTRTGTAEVWTAATDGSGLRRLGNFGAQYLDHPAWSPDGSRIAVSGIFGTEIRVHVLDAETGGARRLSPEGAVGTHAAWGADGQSLLLSSRRGGDWQIWRQPLDGGPPEQLTTLGGLVARETLDGEGIHVVRGAAGRLWRQSLGAESHLAAEADATLVLDDLAPGHRDDWTETDRGIVYLRLAESGLELARLDTSTGVRHRIARIERSVLSPGLSVSRSGDSIVVGLREPMEGDLRMLQGFR